MNFFDGIKRAVSEMGERGVKIRYIMVNPTWTTRGYMFVVQHDDSHYIIANRKDLDAGIAYLIMERPGEDLPDYVEGLPIIEDNKLFQIIIGGVYVWTLQLQPELQQ